MKGKTIAQSKTVLTTLMLPNQTNIAGNIHGGEMMKLMDNTAGVVARKHAESNIVTARADDINFYQPIFVGDLVTCLGELTFVGKSSMEVAVTVTVEHLVHPQKKPLALTGYFTLVALDPEGKPCQVPPLVIETEEEQHKFEAGKERQRFRKEGQR